MVHDFCPQAVFTLRGDSNLFFVHQFSLFVCLLLIVIVVVVVSIYSL